MSNFVVINNTKEEMDHIDVIYSDGQSMDDQNASSDGVTVLSDSSIPTGSSVSEVTINGAEVGFGLTPVLSANGTEVNAILVFFLDPKSETRVIVGTEITDVEDGGED